MKAFVYMMLTVLLIGVCLAGCSKDSGKTVDALNEEALSLLQAGLHSQALEKAKAALKKSEAENGTDFANRVTSLEIMGLVYQAKGDAANAENAFLRALSVVRKSAGPDSVEAAKITNNLAGLYYAQNRYNLALSFFKQSLAIGEKQFPPDDPRLAVMRKNIDVCEGFLNKGAAAKSADADNPGPVGEESAVASQTESPVKTPPVNMVQDLVPQKVKDSTISQLAKQNIFISDLKPKPPVLIDNKGMVFPYHALKKEKGTDAVQEIVVLFAAIKNPEKPKALVFQQCRLISNTSYLSALEKGGVVQLEREIRQVFPSLYL